MTTFTESASLGEKVGGKYRVKIIAVGQGSSGYYSETLLENYGPTAFPAGTHVFLNHKTADEEYNQPERRVEAIAGFIDDAPIFEAQGAQGPGLYGTVRFKKDAENLISEIKDHVGLSIHARGSSSEGPDGTPVIETLDYHPFNSVDIVTRAGAGGRILELMESYTDSSGTLDTKNDALSGASTNPPERDAMTPEDLEKITTALKEALSEFGTELRESLKPEPVEKPAEETDAPDLVAANEAALEAGLTKVQRAKVTEAVKAGTSVEDAVKEQKDFLESVRAEAAAATTFTEGALASASGSATASYGVKGWN